MSERRVDGAFFLFVYKLFGLSRYRMAILKLFDNCSCKCIFFLKRNMTQLLNLEG